MSFLSGKKILLLGFVVSLLVIIPVTVYFLQKQQQTESGAAKSTTLCFTSSPNTSSCLAASLQKTVGDTFSLDVLMKPETNQVIATTLNINYDPTKIATTEAGLVRSADAFTSVIEGPVYTEGNISITMSVGIDLTRVVKTDTKVATITFKALSLTEPTGTQVTFTDQTNVTSTVSDPETNVLSTAIPATIVILAGNNPTPTAAATPSPTPIVVRTSPTPNIPPACTSLNIDRAATGSAPLSITFTANGNDTDGTISKVTFDFGDGPMQDVTQAGGIGTNTVSVQATHAYNNPGSFTARAILTDSNNGTSIPNACTQAITVEPATPPIGGGETPAPTAPPVVEPTSTPTPTMVPGPGSKIIGIGAAGIILTIIGGALFLAL
ncbi:MAG: cohesin domain-containing protein [Candidatus Levybacteria bacterium]|nr:cohesin domain-containing protein [Candidatus Levybacteria bacterium]